jgi:hypothetical protein
MNPPTALATTGTDRLEPPDDLFAAGGPHGLAVHRHGCCVMASASSSVIWARPRRDRVG